MLSSRVPLRLLGILICFVNLFGGLAQAEELLSLRQAVEQAMVLNFRLAVSNEQVAEARGQQVQAGLRINPRLTVQTEDIRSGTRLAPFSFVNSTEDYLTLGQVLETGGKRQRRLDLARSVVRGVELERQLTRLQVVSRVSLAYWSAAAARGMVSVLEVSLRTFEEDVRYSQNRVNEGVMAEEDLTRVELERDRVQVEVLAAQRAIDQTTIDLYRIMGRTDFGPLVLSDSIETAGTVALPEIERVLQSRPDVQIARNAVTEAEANLRLQRAAAKPDPEAFVGYKRNIGYDTLYGAVQVDLPIHNRNQGNLASAQARLRVAEVDVKLVETEVRAEVKAASLAYRDQLRLVEQLPRSLRRARESERLTRAAYREGGIDLLRLLDVERSRIQIEMNLYRAQADLKQSIVALQAAEGQADSAGVTP